MKAYFKFFLFGCSIFYSIVIIILMSLSLYCSNSSVSLVVNKENDLVIENYKTEMGLLKDKACADVINSMIKYYEETAYNGEVNLRELYEYANTTSFLPLYVKARENCNITDEDNNKHNLPAEVLTIVMQQENLFQRYYYQYELSMKDIYTRYMIDPTFTPTEYNIRKKMELEVIGDLIEIVNEKEGGRENEKY